MRSGEKFAALIALGGVALAASGPVAGWPLYAVGGVVLAGAVALWRWPLSDSPGPPPSQQPSPRVRKGYVGKEGSRGDFDRVTFGKDLDVGIENQGEVNVTWSEFE
jgi:hypothetical protein